ncbi:MAG: hypothetical protein E5Y06_25220 [Mesorhizobium sp.]|nr:MAG: hypothetical protein E5Y06_25220 [Mesorhizobium sp.]TJU97408.1 MAG: hypothetical protein E5Y08_17975 [Mesorhizobium sp.]TJV16465.1 MAG: hypothetical protein E5Y07_16710 [Mesorhizobium sp.]
MEPIGRNGDLPFSPCGRRWPREARSDEGCSRERQRLTPLEHPSSVSALRADPPSPTRGEGRNAFRLLTLPGPCKPRSAPWYTSSSPGSRSRLAIRG